MSRIRLLPEGRTLVLDRYQLIGRIATGGMGSVYLARNAGVGGFQRFVAIKRLHPHLAQEPEFVEMFLDEARLAASIHHPNVVPIHEIGTIDGSYFVVMDYVEGESLAHLAALTGFRSDGFPRSILLRIILDALTGLHAAHEQQDEEGKALGLVHRDCSPQNILVGVDGHSRITDFGIARASSRLATTRKGSVKGKLAYMAPEQVQEEPVDRRTDLFAVGIILWEGLAARRLFKAETEAKTLKRLLMGEIPPLSKVVPKIHPSLEQLCVKSLQREPAKRFQTALEMADALENAARAAAGPDSGQGIATVREVAEFMANVLGDEMDSQRDSIRDWLSKTPPSARVIGSDGPLSSSVPSGADRSSQDEPTNPRAVPVVFDGIDGDGNAFDDLDTLVRPSFVVPAAGTNEAATHPSNEVAVVPGAAPSNADSVHLPMTGVSGRKLWLVLLLVVLLAGAVVAVIFFRDDEPRELDGVGTATSAVASPTPSRAGTASATEATVGPSASSPVPEADAGADQTEDSPPPDDSATARPHNHRPVSTRPGSHTTAVPSKPTSTPSATATDTTTTTSPRVDDDLANPYR